MEKIAGQCAKEEVSSSSLGKLAELHQVYPYLNISTGILII